MPEKNHYRAFSALPPKPGRRITGRRDRRMESRTWSETPAWFRTELSVASDASIALSFGDVSDAYQFFPSPLRISDNPDYRANLQHCRITDIDYKRNHAGVSDHVRF